MKRVLGPAFLVILMLLVFSFNGFSQEKMVLKAQAVSKLFSIVEEYCQFKVMNGDKYDKEFFSFLLNKLRNEMALHIALNFEQRKIWIIEPLKEFHVMMIPKYTCIEDDEMFNELKEIFSELGVNVLGKAYKANSVKALEFQIFAYNGPTSLRNEVKVELSVQQIGKNGNIIEKSFDKKAYLKW